MAARIRVSYPSEKSVQLLRQLRVAVRPARTFRAKQDPTPILAALIDAREPGVLRDLIGITVEADPEWQGECAHAVSAIAEPLIPDQLPDWDEWVRRSWSALVNSDDPWRHLNSRMIDKGSFTTRDDLIVIGLCASHPDGFVREAAVGRLAQNADGSELGFLILRANDWVVSVRMRATTALMDRLKPSYASSFVRHLPLLDYLVRATRSDHAPLLRSIETFLRGDEGLPALLATIDAPDYRVRRRCFELIRGAYSSLPEWLLEKALSDSDVVIRFRTYAELIAGSGSMPPLLRRAARDSFARIRRLAFETCLRSDAATRDQLLKEFLFDRSGELRRDAQRQWRTLKLGDAAGVYRESLKTNSAGNTPWAIAGLGETGTAADSDVVKGFLAHRHSRVRRMAIRSICQLQPPQFLNTVIEMLFTDTQGVAAVAEFWVAKHIRRVPARPMWDRAVNSGDVHSQFRVLRVFRQLSKWDHLEWLLRALTTSSDIREFALKELDGWSIGFNTSFTAPTPMQYSTVTALFAEVKTLFPSGRVSDIEFLLKQNRV